MEAAKRDSDLMTIIGQLMKGLLPEVWNSRNHENFSKDKSISELYCFNFVVLMIQSHRAEAGTLSGTGDDITSCQLYLYLKPVALIIKHLDIEGFRPNIKGIFYLDAEKLCHLKNKTVV